MYTDSGNNYWGFYPVIMNTLPLYACVIFVLFLYKCVSYNNYTWLCWLRYEDVITGQRSVTLNSFMDSMKG